MQFCFNLFLVMALGLFTNCTATGVHTDNSPPAVALPKETLRNLHDSVFEVVIPKVEDSFVQYEKALPFDRLPFQIRNDKFFGVGTAFAVGPNRYLSAAHVFHVGYRTLWNQYFLRDKKGNVYAVGNIQKFSNDRDLIEFELKEPISTARPVEFNDKFEVGDNVFTVGNAQGEGISYRNGVISSTTPEEFSGRWKFIRFSAPASPGNSGGPLIDSSGKVVGVVARRNMTENLNYAVPISEYKALANQTAYFVERHIKLALGKLNVDHNWEFSVKLPKTREALSKEADSSRGKLLSDMVKELRLKEDKSFEGPGFKEYLTHQALTQSFGFLESDGNDGNWKLNEIRTKTIDLKPNQKAHFSTDPKSGISLIMVEKPEDMSFESFSSPKYMMDALLKAIELHRNLGGEKILITSYGDPKETTVWKDKLGRPWSRSRWLFEGSDAFADMNCMPLPSGEFCISLMGTAALLSYPTEELSYQQATKINLTYKGTIKQWQSYLALKDDKRPEMFNSSHIDLSKNGELHAQVGLYNLKYQDKGLSEDSKLAIKTGYHVGKAFGPEVLLMLLHAPSETFLQLHEIFEPLSASSKENKDRWKHILAKSDHYNNKMYLKNNYSHLTTPIEKRKDVAFIADCNRENSEASDGLAEICEKFTKGMSIQQ